MEYLLHCDCGKSITVTKAMAGQQLTCECGKNVDVPTLRGFSQLKAADDSPVSPKAEKNYWAGPRGILFALLGAVAFYASYRTVIHVWRVTLLDSNYTVEDYLEETGAEWNSYGPDELTTVFDDFNQYALKAKTPPMYYIEQKVAEAEQQSANMWGIIAGVGWILCFVIWLTTPKSVKT